METIHSVCCGLDVHQASVSACLRRVATNGTVGIENRQFSTTVQGLTELSDWLTSAGCPIAAMESTGVYWKPVLYILSGTIEVGVVNARDVKQRRGKKTDRADAQWIAELLAYGLIEPSFVPPPHISALRDVIRMRTALVQMRTQVKNRVLAVLEDTNVKMASVVSDPFGVSGRKMMDALAKGDRDPKALSQLAKGVLRRKIPKLEAALEGTFTDEDDSEAGLYQRVGQPITYRELCELMITGSSNLATNILIDRLSPQRIQQTSVELGAGGMQVVRGVEDARAYQAGRNNTTTARALLVLMQAIAEGRAVSPAASKEMVEILKSQKVSDGIPAGVPAGTTVAHKTGEISTVNHDAAIVYPRGRSPYILVVLTCGIPDAKVARSLIVDISRSVYAKR